MITEQHNSTPAIILWKITGTNIYCISQTKLHSIEARLNAICKRIKLIIDDNKITKGIELIYYGEEDISKTSIPKYKHYTREIIKHFSQSLIQDNSDNKFVLIAITIGSMSNSRFFVTERLDLLLKEVKLKFNKNPIVNPATNEKSFELYKELLTYNVESE